MPGQGDPIRTPEELLADYDAGCQGRADIDMRNILCEIIEDIGGSWILAMQDAGLPDGVIEVVTRLQVPYYVDHYGDL